MTASNIESILHENRSFPPPPDFTARARITPAKLVALNAEAERDNVAFWARLAREELSWHTKFKQTLDDSQAPNYRWFADGMLNASYNCLDVHLPANGDKPAIKTSAFETVDGGEKWGTLTAIDLKAKGKILWQQKTDDPLIGGVLATAGGLVFTGEGKGDLSAFDAKSGERLWGFNCGAGVNAPPVSYAVDGQQYVAVAAGGNSLFGYRQGGAIVVFGLSD